MKAGQRRSWEPIQIFLTEIKPSLKQILNQNVWMSKHIPPENEMD